MEKELKNEVGSVQMYEIYKTTTGLYIKEVICNEFGVGDKENIKIIKDNQCLRVTEDEIKYISQNSSNRLFPIYITIFDLQLVMAFNVYVDVNHNNDLYVSESLCKKNNIVSETHRVINELVCCKVTENDLEIIENNTKNEKIKLQRKLIDTEIETEVNSNEYLFIYYYDVDTQKSYITRDILELGKKLDVSIESTPKIINDKNCYSITEEELKELESKSTYRGVQRLVKEGKELPEEITNELVEENTATENEFNNQPNKTVIDDITYFQHTVEVIPDEVETEPIEAIEEVDSEDQIFEDDIISYEPNYSNNDLESTVENIVNDLVDTTNNYGSNNEIDYTENENNNNLENVVEDIVSDFEEPIKEEILDTESVREEIIVNNEESKIEETKPEIETVIVYRDRRTNKLYIPGEHATNIDRESKIIMRKFCYETTIYELERIYNKKIIIVDVFPLNKQIYNVIVCNNNGKFYIPEHTVQDLNIDIAIEHKIMVNKEIYVEITRSDLDAIKGKETKDLEINIELKHITPTKKRN